MSRRQRYDCDGAGWSLAWSRLDLRGLGSSPWLHDRSQSSLSSLERAKWGRENFVHAKVRAHLATFAGVTLAWVFFRAEQFGPALEMIESMLGLNGMDLPRSMGFTGKGDHFRFDGMLPNQVADLPFALSGFPAWACMVLPKLATGAESPFG